MPHQFPIGPGGFRDLPEKKTGRHRWVAIATYTVSEEAVASMYEDDGNQVILDQENIWDLSTGCIDCERVYEKNVKRYCDAPAYEG